MSEPCGHEHERTVAVRESAYNSGSAPDLADNPFKRIIGLDLAPMIAWEAEVNERLVAAVCDEICSTSQLHALQLRGDLSIFGRRRFGVLLRVKVPTPCAPGTPNTYMV